MIRYLFPSLFAVCLAVPAGAETLGQAVGRAVVHFPEIQSALSRETAAAAQTGQARAELMPSVNATVGMGRERSRNPSTRFQPDDPRLTRREADLSMSQLLFDGGAAAGQVKRFGAREEGARFATVETAESAGTRAGQVYVDVRRLREQLGLARLNVQSHEKTLGDVTALADAGRGKRADVTQAEARRALALSAAEQLSGQLEQTESAFRFFTGRPPGALEAPPPLGSRIPATLELALKEAIDAHPSVRGAQKEFEAAEFDYESTRARFAIPRVTLETGTSGNRNLDGVTGANSDLYAMLRLRYNLFRGFGDVERMRESQARIDEAISNLARARNEIERDVRQAWNTLASDRLRLPVLESYARASAEVSESYRLQFQLGQRSLLDVLNAENERFNAVSGYVAGQAAVAAGEIRLLGSLGRFLDSVGVSRPTQIREERAP